MKVTIEASSQEEFDAKRDDLASLIKGGVPALQPRRSTVKAQNEILDHWDARYNKMVTALKEEISQILAE